VPLPADATAQIAALVADVRAAGVPGGGHDVRWVRLDGLHLTLRFLGPTLDERIVPAREALRAAASGIASFDVSIGAAGAFPSASRPRALWLGVQHGEVRLTELAATVDRALIDAGWDLETKPYVAHLTLARADGIPAGSAIGARLVTAAAAVDIRFRADRIGLFESLTGGGPARYEPLEMAELA
jgi:2'-5' RNA ligase